MAMSDWWSIMKNFSGTTCCNYCTYLTTHKEMLRKGVLRETFWLEISFILTSFSSAEVHLLDSSSSCLPTNPFSRWQPEHRVEFLICYGRQHSMLAIFLRTSNFFFIFLAYCVQITCNWLQSTVTITWLGWPDIKIASFSHALSIYFTTDHDLILHRAHGASSPVVAYVIRWKVLCGFADTLKLQTLTLANNQERTDMLLVTRCPLCKCDLCFMHHSQAPSNCSLDHVTEYVVCGTQKCALLFS